MNRNVMIAFSIFIGLCYLAAGVIWLWRMT